MLLQTDYIINLIPVQFHSPSFCPNILSNVTSPFFSKYLYITLRTLRHAEIKPNHKKKKRDKRRKWIKIAIVIVIAIWKIAFVIFCLPWRKSFAQCDDLLKGVVSPKENWHFLTSRSLFVTTQFPFPLWNPHVPLFRLDKLREYQLSVNRARNFTVWRSDYRYENYTVRETGGNSTS